MSDDTGFHSEELYAIANLLEKHGELMPHHELLKTSKALMVLTVHFAEGLEKLQALFIELEKAANQLKASQHEKR